VKRDRYFLLVIACQLEPVDAPAGFREIGKLGLEQRDKIFGKALVVDRKGDLEKKVVQALHVIPPPAHLATQEHFMLPFLSPSA
jgi:hypothetical protein